MKKLILIFFTLACITVKAQTKESQSVLDRIIWDEEMLNIMIDTRVDYRADLPNYGEKEMGFQAQTIKLWFVGEIVPGIRFRLRHRLNKPQQPTREGYSGATDHAWLAFDAGRNKNWTITVGKQSVQLGTFEFDYNPADVYLSTMVNNDFDGYKTGVNVAYTISGQILNLQVFNSDNPQFASYDYRNRAIAAAFLWQGSLWDGAVKTRVGYCVYQHTKTRWYNWVTPGIQLNAHALTLELDYYFGERNIDYSANIPSAESETRFVRDQSVSLNLFYNLGRFKPAVKFTWNDRYDKYQDAGAYQNYGAQAALEYYPFQNKYLKDLRFHVMYSFNEFNFRGVYGSERNLGTHTVLAGMRWLFKAK